jgi:hypothetical protein
MMFCRPISGPVTGISSRTDDPNHSGVARGVARAGEKRGRRKRHRSRRTPKVKLLSHQPQHYRFNPSEQRQEFKAPETCGEKPEVKKKALLLANPI